MEWLKTLATVAPSLATAIGGPLAGMAVATISKAIGLTKTDAAAVEEAVMSGSPDTLLKLRQADQDFKIRLKELDIDLAQIEAQRLESVNATMRMEAGSDHWPTFTWRPFIGFIFGILVFGDYFVLPLLGIEPPEVPANVWLAMGAILGVASYGHSKALADPNNTAITRG